MSANGDADAELYREAARIHARAADVERAAALSWLEKGDVDRAAKAWERSSLRRAMARIAEEHAERAERA